MMVSPSFTSRILVSCHVGVLSFVTVTGLQHKGILTDVPLQRLKRPVFVRKGESTEWKNGKHCGWTKCMLTF